MGIPSLSGGFPPDVSGDSASIGQVAPSMEVCIDRKKPVFFKTPSMKAQQPPLGKLLRCTTVVREKCAE